MPTSDLTAIHNLLSKHAFGDDGPGKEYDPVSGTPEPENGFSSAFPNPMQEGGKGLANPGLHQPQGRLSSDEKAESGVDDSGS